MKELLKFSAFRVLLIMFSLLTLVVACDNYDEGDEAAKQSFEKMTVVEKGMYDAVEEEWGTSYLQNVRQAVLGREVKPLETNIPFIDIANVIKSNNDITLKINENWTTDDKNKAISARWDRLDDKWYVKIIAKLGLKEGDIQKQDFVVEEVIQDKPDIKPSVSEDKVNDIKPIIVKENFDSNEGNDLLLLQEYDDLYYDLRGCDPAIDKYDEIIQKRLLTKKDRDYLIQLATKCKAIKIGAKLRP
jgi:hypothetical protein